VNARPDGDGDGDGDDDDVKRPTTRWRMSRIPSLTPDRDRFADAERATHVGALWRAGYEAGYADKAGRATGDASEVRAEEQRSVRTRD
jgi:hypothetical protein